MSLPFWRKRAPNRSRPAASTSPTPATNAPIRVTDDRDGEVLNRGYAYWPACVVETDGRVLLFVGFADWQPRFFRVNLTTGDVERLGPLLGAGSTAEGWYFDSAGNVMMCDGPRLRRVHPPTGESVVVLDISDTHPGCRLWQAHSSDDGFCHSATVERIVPDGAYPRLGTVVQFRDDQVFFEAGGTLDESHVDASGNILIIEEDNGNRIIHLGTRDEERISNAEGALSHLDCGDGFMVGEDDQAGACTWMDLYRFERRVLFSTWNQGVVSVKGGRCIVTDATHVKRVALDGSGVTPLATHGMTGSGYDFACRANLDPTGRVAFWLSNAAGRMDAYLLPL